MSSPLGGCSSCLWASAWFWGAMMGSLVTFALAGQVVWVVGIPAAVCGIAGSYVGSGLALKNGAKVIRPMFFVVLALLTIRLVYDLLFS